MTGILGSPPDLRQLPTGCVFHPRCRFAFDRCEVDDPPLEIVGHDGSRLAACWRQHGDRPVPVELAAPEPELAIFAAQADRQVQVAAEAAAATDSSTA
jgi:peptide/nickel transport system ATP-binding protein